MSETREFVDRLKGKIKLRVAIEKLPDDCTEEDLWILEAYTQGRKDGWHAKEREKLIRKF